jgi:sialate O-acetylesterase
MAVIIDIGDAANIHPSNKQEVGRRLALAALGTVYGQDIVYSGPIYDSMQVAGPNVRLKFKHVGSGLATQDDAAPRGFAVAGEDGRFVWASARIEGDEVVVWSDGVPRPAAVRYAWADNPDCNLCNKEGLPASPFRTDR